MTKYMVLKKLKWNDGGQVTEYYPPTLNPEGTEIEEYSIIFLPGVSECDATRLAYWMGIITDDEPIVVAGQIYHPEDKRVEWLRDLRSESESNYLEAVKIINTLWKKEKESHYA
jgi:hypothetical protein